MFRFADSIVILMKNKRDLEVHDNKLENKLRNYYNLNINISKIKKITHRREKWE